MTGFSPPLATPGGPGGTDPRPSHARLGAAGLVLAAYGALAVVLRLASPPSAAHYQAADPFLLTLQAGLGAWGVPLLSVGLGLGLLGWRRPAWSVLRRELLLAALGAAAAAALLLLLRAASGPSLPSFIPPEESAAPGRVLGLEAGVAEEALFRLVLLPLLLAGLARLVPRHRWIAVLGAAVVVGLLFAFGHELPPAGPLFELPIFVTRVLVPGVAMSLLFLWPGPSFLVSAHCAAHLVMPLLFH